MLYNMSMPCSLLPRPLQPSRLHALGSLYCCHYSVTLQVCCPHHCSAAATFDTQLAVSITSITGGGSAYQWGLANTVLPPNSIQLAKGATAEVTFTTAFTQIPSTGKAPLTIEGAIVVTNPTAEPMELTEIEVSYLSDDAQQQLDTPASCPTTVGGTVLIDASSTLTCTFVVTYNSQQMGSLWASAVTAAGLRQAAPQVPIETVGMTVTNWAKCATVGQSFQSGEQGFVAPASFTTDSQLPPVSGTSQQICNSDIYTYTAVFGPMDTCGKLQVGCLVQRYEHSSVGGMCACVWSSV